MLDKKGNSNTAERIALMSEFVRLFEVGSILISVRRSRVYRQDLVWVADEKAYLVSDSYPRQHAQRAAARPRWFRPSEWFRSQAIDQGLVIARAASDLGLEPVGFGDAPG